MGVSIAKGVNAVPAELKDGILRYWVHNKVFEMQVPVKREFKKQCNFFYNPNIFAYLRDGDYSLIIRWDKTACLDIEGEEPVLCKVFSVPNLILPEYTAEVCGATRNLQTNTWELNTLLSVDKNNAILYTQNLPMLISLDLSENLQLKECISSFEYPEVCVGIILEGNKAFAVNTFGAKMYSIVGQVVRQDGFTML